MNKHDNIKPRRKWIPIVLFVLLNVIVIAITAVNEFGNSANAAALSEVNIIWWLLIPATLCFAVATLANVAKYVLMIREADHKKSRVRDVWKLSWRVVMLGRYYDNITPASIGGQPFQIYYMRKHSELQPGYTTSIPICGMIASQIGFLAIALFCFALGGVFNDNPALLVTAWVGSAVYAFWPVTVIGTIIWPKGIARLLQFGVKILAKMRIVKHREQTLRKVENEVTEYAKVVKTILKIRGLFLKVVILAIVYNLAISIIPYFVLMAFGGDIDFWQCLATTVAVTAAVYFVPTPGNAGAAEGTFYAVFSSLSTGYVFWAMLVWRLFSYYSYIIIGPIIYLRAKVKEQATPDNSRQHES